MHGKIHQNTKGLFVVVFFRISREHRETLAKSAKTLYMQTKEKLNGVNGKYSKKINKKENQNHHGRDLLEKLTKMVRIYLRHHQNCMYVCI